MPDITDVELALATLIANAVYPSGTGGPSAIGVPVTVAPCWPTQDDLKAGKTFISIWAMSNAGRDTTRFLSEWLVEPPGVATVNLTIAINGTAITFGGTVIVGQFVSMIVNGKTYSYAIQAGNTVTSLATALATLVSVDTPATSLGAVLTIPAMRTVVVRVGGVATMAKEIRRRVHRFMVTVWAPSRALRTTAGRFLDQLFADTVFVNLPDATCGWVTYAGDAQTDATGKESIWRRDHFLNVDFPNVDVDQGWQVTLPVTTIAPVGNLTDAPVNTVIVNF